MQHRRSIPILGTTMLALLVAFASTRLLRAEESTPGAASDPVARAEALLDAGQIEEAARAFRDASRARPRDAALRDRAMVLRRVASLRRFVATQPDAEQWAASAVALHAFYLDENLPALSLELARQAYERDASARYALMLAESYLALGRDRDAAALLAARPEPTPHEKLLNGIALARLDHDDAARGLTSTIVLGEDAPPAMLQDAARLRALLGETDGALALLRQSFERTPPPALAAARTRAQRSPDFAALRDTEAFRQVLATASKVKQTCSGGSSCATCPNRGGCGS